MITLYGRKSSDSVQKTAWMLGETGRAFEHVELGGKFGGLDGKKFLTLNPHGRVPVLVDGELVRPQPGEFYGGWITNDIVGPFKGEAGSTGW